MSTPLSAPAALARERPGARPARCAPPCTIVIFGARGDLARRKLMPAIAHLAEDGLLAADSRVIGIGTRPMSDDEFRKAMGEAIGQAGDGEGMTPPELLERLSYVSGDIDDEGMYRRLQERLATSEGGAVAHRLFYLAVPPALFPPALRHLSASRLMPRQRDDGEGWARVIIEKPFGSDLASARALNRLVRSAFSERQVFRIDHYLGKETVQNLLVHRFANSIFEPVWNRDHVHHVQITVAETVGVEHRASFYEQAGVIRDVFQNHLLQLLALTTMEPPNTFDANAVRHEKVKVLGAVRAYPENEARQALVAGQYGAGAIGGKPVPGYREEPGVTRDSSTPTFAALRLEIHNWRWRGVPFFLRSGKRLARRFTEIAVRFHRPPHLLFPLREGDALDPNVLTFRIQPEEQISLGFEVKVPGPDVRVTPVRMVFSYADAFDGDRHPAYETLLLDCMEGDQTLFDRADSVEEAWRIIDPIAGAAAAVLPENYPAGSWGPSSADALIARSGASWRNQGR